MPPEWPVMTAIPLQYDPNVCRNIRKWAKMTPRRHQKAPKAPAKWHQYGPNKAQKGPQEDSKSDLKMSLAMTLHDSKTPKLLQNCSKLIPEIHPKWSKPNSVDSKNAPRNALCRLLLTLSVISVSILWWFFWGHSQVIFCGHFVVTIGSFLGHFGHVWYHFGFVSWSFRGYFVTILGSFCGLSGPFLEHFWDRFRGHFGDIFRAPMAPKTFQTAPKLTPKMPQVDPKTTARWLQDAPKAHAKWHQQSSRKTQNDPPPKRQQMQSKMIPAWP